MPVIIKGPLCLVCGGNNVEIRHFWQPVMWTSKGPVDGNAERAVCLDCDGDIGSKYQLTKNPETHNGLS